jgi:PelA/Pel-15E family pectate lyase
MNQALQSQTFRQKKDFISTQISVNMKDMRLWIVTFWLCLLASVIAADARGKSKPVAHVTWRRCLSRPAEFYAGDEAVRIAENVLLYQRNTGGWPKNREMAAVLTEQDKAKLRRDRSKNDSTLDNGATHTQLRYLAKVYHATKMERFKDAFLKGLDYLLEAQYDNGGWPQYYPRLTGYHKRITFNDGATIGAMTVLRDVAGQKPPYVFIDEDHRLKAEAAVQKGIDCILKCQIVVDGKKTAWCAQHDEKSFAPRQARSYELPSISGSESVGVVRFLMDIDKPGPEIVEAIQSAVA